MVETDEDRRRIREFLVAQSGGGGNLGASSGSSGNMRGGRGATTLVLEGAEGLEDEKDILHAAQKVKEDAVIALTRAMNALRQVDQVLQTCTMFWNHLQL